MKVRMAPVRYSFAQEVILFHREKGPVESNGTGGWTVSRIGEEGIGGGKRVVWVGRNGGGLPFPVNGHLFCRNDERHDDDVSDEGGMIGFIQKGPAQAIRPLASSSG